MYCFGDSVSSQIVEKLPVGSTLLEGEVVCKCIENVQNKMLYTDTRMYYVG